MAGKIVADIIESAGSQISLNVGNVTILTASSSGLTLTPTSNVNINVSSSTLAFGAGSVSLPSITTSGDTNTGLYFPAADTIGFTEGGVEAMRINSSGNLQTLGTISVGAATPSTSGAGITFPATQSASSDANTLDDYEEGTWTAAFVPASGSITISTSFNTGRYTKVGRLVTVNLHARFTSVSSPSGSLAITGLPFTSSATGQQDRNAGAVAAIAVTTSATPMTAYITNGVTQMTLTGFVAASGGYADAATYINASSELYITITYYV